MFDFVQMHWISWAEMERRRESRYGGDNLYQGPRYPGNKVPRYPGNKVPRYPDIKVPRYRDDNLYQGGKLGIRVSRVPRWSFLSRWQTRWSPVSPVYLIRPGLTWWTIDAGESLVSKPWDGQTKRPESHQSGWFVFLHLRLFFRLDRTVRSSSRGCWSEVLVQ